MRTPPTPRPALFVAVVTVLAIAASACGSSAATVAPSPSNAATSALSGTPGATPASAEPSSASTSAPTETASVTPSVAPTETTMPASAAPSESASPPASVAPVPTFVIPSFTSDKELEAALPDTYKGVTLKKFSISGATLVQGTSQSTKEFVALIQSLGKTPADLSFAFATDPTRKLGVTFGAYRIKGVDAGAWVPTLFQIAQRQTPGASVTDVNLGGKAVKRFVLASSKQISYLWPRGDVLFIVSTTTDALAGDAIAAMP